MGHHHLHHRRINADEKETMKLFITALLACAVVASQAAVYEAPAYEYWCARNFYVVPADSWYCYQVPFNKEWCSTKYYTQLLPVFPKAIEEGTCEPELDDVTATLADYEQTFAEARVGIESEMRSGLAAFTTHIDEVGAVYLDTFKQYLSNCVASDSDEFAARVVEYERKLSQLRCDAIVNFHTAVAAAMEKVACFQNGIIASFSKCLETRAGKLAAYNLKLDERITKCVGEYELRLKEIIQKRIDWTKCVLERIYGNDKSEEYEAAVEKYQCALVIQIAVYVNQFRQAATRAGVQMKENYRCNYKCYFATGCYGFSRKAFQKSEVQFPAPPKYAYKLVGLNAFNVDWKGTDYECLTTCSAEDKTPTFDEAAHIASVESKSLSYKEDLACKVNQWMVEIAQWKADAQTALSEEIACFVPVTYCGAAPTQEEIAAFQLKMQGQADKWIEVKEQELLAQVTALQARITCSIDAWKDKSVVYVGKVKQQFECCVASRTEKIASYTQCLETRRSSTRAELVERLQKLSEQHKCAFDRFMDCTFGDLPEEELFAELRLSYKGCVDDKVNAVVEKFDDWWTTWQPQLLEHYQCGLRCTVNMSCPTLKLSYKWNLCAPQISDCRFVY